MQGVYRSTQSGSPLNSILGNQSGVSSGRADLPDNIHERIYNANLPSGTGVAGNDNGLYSIRTRGNELESNRQINEAAQRLRGGSGLGSIFGQGALAGYANNQNNQRIATENSRQKNRLEGLQQQVDAQQQNFDNSLALSQENREISQNNRDQDAAFQEYVGNYNSLVDGASQEQRSNIDRSIISTAFNRPGSNEGRLAQSLIATEIEKLSNSPGSVLLPGSRSIFDFFNDYQITDINSENFRLETDGTITAGGEAILDAGRLTPLLRYVFEQGGVIPPRSN